MKIRTQFFVTLLIFGLLVTGMAASLIFTNRQVDELRQQEEIAHRIEQGANELNYLSGDYLMYGENQQRARWEARFASFSKDLARLRPADLEQQTIIGHMIADQERLRALFSDVVSTLETSISNAGSPPDVAFNQVSWSRMEVQNQSIAFEAALLSQKLREQADRLRQLNFVLIFSLVGAFGAYLITNYYLIEKRTLKSIAELHAGIEIIGSGNLDFSIAVKRADEIGGLSHAFNVMTANLRDVTASKADLEREVAERKQAETALRQSEERFRLALSHAPVSVATQDPDLVYTWAYNQKTHRVDEIVGKTDTDLFPPQAIHLTDLKRRVLETGENMREQLWVTGNGHELFLDLFIEPLRNELGEIEGISLATVDLTQVKLAEEALREANDKLQEQARELELRAEELRAQKNELVIANEQLRLSEELTNQRRTEIQATNQELQAARLAALNLMEDALSAQEKIKQINLRLRESEQRLNRAQEIAHLGSWELDLVNNQLTWSDEVYRIFGLEPQEFNASYDAFLEAVHPDDRAAVDDAYSSSIRDGKNGYEIEHRIIRHSTGEIRIVHEKCEHIRNESGQIVRSGGMVHDITERKQAERRLTYLASFPERNPNPVIEVDFDGHVYYANTAALNIIPDLAERGSTHPWLAGLDKIVSAFRESQTNATSRDVVFGERVYQQSVSILAEDRLIRMYATDITERKQAEEELRLARDELEMRVLERTQELAVANRDLLNEIRERKEIEGELRIQTTAMEAAASGIVITDRRGNIQWINPALVQMSGYDAHDLIGHRTHIFRSGQHDAVYYRHMWDTILAGEVWRGETINRRKDHSLYVEEQTITPVRDEQNAITHFIAIKQDITERKQAEAELERRNAELQTISNAERNQRQFSEALVSAALVLNKSLKLDEVLSLILEQIKGVIPYQLADITLLDGDTFYDAAHQGDVAWPPAQMGVNNHFSLESFPLFSRMCQSGESVLVPDTQEEPDWIQVEGLAWTRSFLSAPLLAEKKVIGFVNLFSDQPAFFTQEMTSRLVAFAIHAAVAIQNAWLFEQVRASTERLQSLSHRLVEIQENERLYISRELHDEAGQVLTSLLVDLRLLEKNASQSDVILKIVAEMETSLNRVTENLHRIAMSLRPASLDHVGLVAALRQHVESVGEKNNLLISFSAGKAVERLPANVETVIYRVVQEALTNAVRYAHATRVDVVLTVREGKLIVIVEDDGIGFDSETVASGEHLGLFGMRERAEMIDGKLAIESAPGKGTTIMLEVSYADTVIGRG